MSPKKSIFQGYTKIPISYIDIPGCFSSDTRGSVLIKLSIGLVIIIRIKQFINLTEKKNEEMSLLR